MPEDNNTLWSAARSYARNGIYVNPVYVTRKVDGKKDVRPVGLWRKTSSASLADIGAWEQDHPDASLLIDCGKSKIVVVDCDGEEGIANWLNLFPQLRPPIALGVAATPSGGRHYFYREHPDHPIGNDQDGKVAPSVDIRGIGGFVFAPPSHDGSGAWEWIDGPVWNAAADCYVPDVVIERMKAGKATTPGPASSAPAADIADLVDSAEHRFTKEQAKAYVRDACARLAGATSGFNGAINNFAMACAHFPWLVDRERCAKLMIKYLGKGQGWDAPDRDDVLTINSAYSATEAGKSWTAVEVQETAQVVITDDGTEEIVGGQLPAPAQPMLVARELVTRMPITAGMPHWAWWRGDFYLWSGAHWNAEDENRIKHWLYQQTADATYLVPVTKKEVTTYEPAPWAPTRKKISDLTEALGVGTIQRFGNDDHVLAAANGVIVDRKLSDHDPHTFNLWSMPFDYEPAAECPGWTAFLDQVLPGDQEAKDFLAEWFGYVLSGRTDQQKMASLIGKRRSGKGTVARLLGALLGDGNVAGLNLNLISGTFGMEPLVGRALAVAGDVRWASRNIADAVPILLGVIGEDDVTINRKNKRAWHGRLGTRFMLMSNETPTFNDRSGALGGRMVFVHFGQSFYGREDTTLTAKLMGELPGILNWALDGLDRLDERGRFTEPASGFAERDAQRRLADPIGAFLDDWCEIGPEHSISLDHLFLKYQNWCTSEGRTRDSTTKEIFSRDLHAKVESLVSERVRVEGKRMRILTGVGSSVV